MIYLLYGDDKDGARAKAQELLHTLQKKRPDASFFKMNSDSWSPADLSEYIGSQGLFEQKYIVLLDGLFELKEAKEEISKAAFLKEMKESPHIFIFREDELDKATLAKFEKLAQKVQKFSKGEAGAGANDSCGKKKDFNLFSMADALGRRDRKQLWVLYQQAKKAGIEDEQIHGTLFWQVKNMVLARGAKSAAEAKLNPFVFSKAVSFAKDWNDQELTDMLCQLVPLYHDARRGIHELDVAMERFVLGC